MKSATYKFGKTLITPCIHFYAHADGSPEAAAKRFAAMMDFENRTGGLAGRFVRANSDVTFVRSHEAEPLASYRYSVEPDDYLVAQRFEDGRWTVFWHGTLPEFVEAFRPDAGRYIFAGYLRSVKSLRVDLERSLLTAEYAYEQGWFIQARSILTGIKEYADYLVGIDRGTYDRLLASPELIGLA